MKTTIQSDFALTELRPSLTLLLLWDVMSVWTCLCICWHWGSWNAASKSIKLIVLSGCLLMYLVSSCSREDHLFLRYDLWNVTWRQQYNLTLPLLSYDQAWPCCCHEMLWVSGLVFATVGIEGLEMQLPSQSSWSSCQDACWCILWAVVAGRITCFFATISEMSLEDNNTIWLCPYWATTKLDPGVVMRFYWCLDLSLHLLELRVLKCSLQVDQVDRFVRMLADVPCEQL